MLVAAMNPCPCGKASSGERRECRCLPTEIRKYQSRISGPILDRFDLQVWVPAVPTQHIVDQKRNANEDTQLLSRVSRARDVQHQRGASSKALLNSNLNQAELREHCKLSDECREVMRKAISRLSLSARAYMRTLRVARTIADLEETEVILIKHLVEALHYRQRVSVK
ncbi:UNVERIFIED_CONTAM: hypothetical protein GTU68_002024 [Idotea baltica]|nr:hypothetical protein [Idotea baltica]